jgi:hypothetical protein
MAANSVVGWMRFLTFRQLAVAACQSSISIALFTAFFVKEAASTQAAWWLAAACPDVAELLAVLSLLLIVVSSVRLDLDLDVKQAC